MNDVEINEAIDEDPWSDDLLNRRGDAEILKAFMIRRSAELVSAGKSRSLVINLDAKWGVGKTFFLSRLQRSLRRDGRLVAYVNAWESEHAHDPLVAVMAGIDAVIAQRLPKKAAARKVWASVKENAGIISATAVKYAAKRAAEKILGEGVEKIVEIASGDGVAAAKEAVDANIFETAIDQYGKSLMEEFGRTQNTISTFRDKLRLFLLNVEEEEPARIPLFVLVDELDRCRPTHAIALLERITHLFSVARVVFVVATDTEQLEHSIRAVYGGGFDSGRYLGRFFDRRYAFRALSYREFTAAKFKTSAIDRRKLVGFPNIDVASVFQRMAEGFKLPTRDTEQCFQIMQDICTVWDKDVPLEMSYLVPMIICFHQHRPEYAVLADCEIPRRDRFPQFAEAMSWTVKFRIRGRELYDKDVEVGAYELLRQLLTLVEKPLPDISSSNTSSPEYRWAQDQLSREFSILHGSTFDPASPPVSVLRSYSEYVRSISQMITQESVDKT